MTSLKRNFRQNSLNDVYDGFQEDVKVMLYNVERFVPVSATVAVADSPRIAIFA